MHPRATGPRAPSRSVFRQSERLNRPEIIVLLILVGSSLVLDFIETATGSNNDSLLGIVSVATSATFLLYLWSAPAGIIALAVAMSLSFVTENVVVGAMAGAIAATPVLRLASRGWIVGYGAVFCTFIAAFIATPRIHDVEIADGILYLIIATISGGVGAAMRVTYAHRRRLEVALVESAEQERAAVLAERRWIAGELHDSIAHHLTIIAMHVQLFDDDSARGTSQEAIRIAARKAMSDLRFVIELAEEAPRGTEVPSGDLRAAIDEACEEFEAAGHTVIRNDDPGDESVPRGAEIILARIVRESATNILKHAGPGDVHISLDVEPASVTLNIRSPQPATPRRDLPSTGTGLNRMAERVLGVKGEFSAGPTGDDWLVTARLPIAESASTLVPSPLNED